MSPPDAVIGETMRRLRWHAAATTGSNDAEDIAQEAVARALAAGVSPDALPWLRAVARNLSVDRRRRSREVPSGDAGDLDPLMIPVPGAEEALLDGERRQAVRDALEKLPPRYRDALLALAEDGRPADVSTRLGISSGAAWTLLSRARDRMRRELDRAGFVPGVFAARFRRWMPSVEQGGAAVGLTIALLAPGAGTTPAPPPALRVIAAAAAAPAAVQPVPAAAPAQQQAQVRAPEPGRRTPTTAARSTPLRWEAKTCTPKSLGGEPVGAGLEFQDSGAPSLSEQLVGRVPEGLRTIVSGGCP